MASNSTATRGPLDESGFLQREGPVGVGEEGRGCDEDKGKPTVARSQQTEAEMNALAITVAVILIVAFLWLVAKSWYYSRMQKAACCGAAAPMMMAGPPMMMPGGCPGMAAAASVDGAAADLTDMSADMSMSAMPSTAAGGDMAYFSSAPMSHMTTY